MNMFDDEDVLVIDDASVDYVECINNLEGRNQHAKVLRDIADQIINNEELRYFAQIITRDGNEVDLASVSTSAFGLSYVASRLSHSDDGYAMATYRRLAEASVLHTSDLPNGQFIIEHRDGAVVNFKKE